MTAANVQAVPHLTTALTGPLQQIETSLLTRQTEIEAWFREQWKQTPPPFYASVDLRNAGFKLAPVDTNLFPAGFNNLSTDFQPLCVHAVQSTIEQQFPEVKRVLLVPENHTRNLFYLENIATLRDMLAAAGLETKLGSLIPDLKEPTVINLPSGRQVTLSPVLRDGDRVGLADFDPCLVLLNNDLSGGLPNVLKDIEQPIVPHPLLGWQQRRKSVHFGHYRTAARELSALIEMDPWLVDPLFRNCGEIDFKNREGEQCLTSNIEGLLKDIQAKYDAYGIDKQPFVVVKADSGTYGMGVITVHDVDEIVQLNRKQRKKMTSTKEGLAISRVIIQEGVYTSETWGKHGGSAEPVVYMLGHFVVGGFYRVHKSKASDENLNAPGMEFEPLAFARSCSAPDPCLEPDSEPNRFYAYGVIARLALVAAARETAEVQQLHGNP